MGVPTSEVGYTPAMSRREDHEVHKRTCVGIGGGGEKKYIRFYLAFRNKTATCTLVSSMCVFRIVMNFRMTYPRSKHVAVLDT